MLNLLQQHNKEIFIIILLFLQPASAYTLKVSPPEINFETDPFMKSCQKIKISSDPGDLEMTVQWSDKQSKELSDYKYSSNDLGIKTIYPDTIKSNQELSFCIELEDSYQYNGLILIQSQERSAGVGIWIRVNKFERLKEPSNKEELHKKTITGRSISEEINNPNSSYLIYLSIIPTLILVLILIILYRKRIL